MLSIYFDICAIKRPWDDQTQVRVAAETQAMLSLMQLVQESNLRTLRSPAHDAENALNSDPRRAATVQEWLNGLELPSGEPPEIDGRVRELGRSGLAVFDALHLAWAESLGADVLVTTDDRFRRRAARAGRLRGVRLMTPVELVQEVAQ